VLGAQITEIDLLPVFKEMLSDVDEVRSALIQHLADFVMVRHNLQVSSSFEIWQVKLLSRVRWVGSYFQFKHTLMHWVDVDWSSSTTDEVTMRWDSTTTAMCIVYCYANDTRTRNRYRKPVPENLFRFSAGVSCESVSIFSGTKIWYGVEQCSTRCGKPWPKWRVLIGQAIASCVVCSYKLCCLLFYCFKINWGTVV